MTIFSRRGTWLTFASSSCSLSMLTSSARYFSLSLGVTSSPSSLPRAGLLTRRDFSPPPGATLLLHLFAALLAHPEADAILTPVAHAGGLRAARTHEHHVARVDGALDLEDAALRVLLGRPGVLLDTVHTLHDHALLLGEGPQDLALLTLVLAGDDLDPVATVNVERTRHLLLLLQDLGRERHDLHVLAVAQLARHRPEDAGAPGVALGVDHDTGVLVELDVACLLY